MTIRSINSLLKDKFYNGSFIEIHSGDLKEIENTAKEYAEQFIDLAVDEILIKDKKVLYTGVRAGNPNTAYYIVKVIDKKSILKIKDKIK